tara:strand:+ start:5110 stop:5676 length:567 start_codon:yes stop_codon:yes gene_type:complete
MDALDALLSRNSVAMLQGPGPDKMQLEKIFQAGLKANDHRRLRPWKFFLIEGEARKSLASLMLDIALRDDPDMSEEKQGKLLAKPLRAPTIVLVVAAMQPDCFDKVPAIEQILSAGGAAQMMMVAAHAQGVGAIWRTGSIAYNPHFRSGLGLDEHDEIVGLLYMGSPKAVKPLQQLNTEDFVQSWSGS